MRSVVLAIACVGAAASSVVGVLRPEIHLFDQAIDRMNQTASVVPDGSAATGSSRTGRVGETQLARHQPQERSRPQAPAAQPVMHAQAQDQTQNQAQAPQQPAPAPGPSAPVVDESALRYFASKGDTARLQAEIARLRALYPNWTPPRDPLAVPQNADEQLERMWQLYSEARYADVRTAIADRQAGEPGWTPPADLLDRLAIAERRSRLIAASDAKRFAEVVGLAADTPSLLTCSDVDILWRVAEAFAGTDRTMRARDAYAYVLRNCANQPERIATIQKAAALLDYADMQELLGFEKTLPDGTREFESIRDDLARRFVAAGDEDGKLAVAVPYIQRVERLVEREGLSSDALLLGWYALRRDDMPTAERWFRKARGIEDTASASQGLALALIDRKMPLEAEEVMHRWYDTSDETKATYLAAVANTLALDPPVAITADVLQRMAAATLKEKDPASAQQFGWYALAFDQPKTAEQWFLSALNWKEDDEPSAYGLAVARLRLRDLTGMRAVQALWQGRSERIARVSEQEPRTRDGRAEGSAARPQAAATGEPQGAAHDAAVTYVRPSGEERAVRRDRQSARARTVAGCRTTLDPQTLPPATALARGWCLMDLNRPLEAAAAFDAALRTTVPDVRRDAAYGQSLAYIRAGLFREAAIAATRAKQPRERAVELQAAILSNRAVAAFDAGRFRETILFLDQLAQLRTERADLMVLRGYAYKGLNRTGDARRIFEALAATGQRDAVRALGDMRDQGMRPH
ncbi:cellulose synthase [Rhizobium sp. GN54]|uniref:cellulose synthase n=1 Tax=Rhizobium sp. GN54 TaxID=2898150 RepID=UPI001E4C2912|nr:cellulose synthase [Rhizobium sp. GN54]MCD2180597.1 cellulose synthase [Rhizobium sp. GN54]